MNPLNKNRRPGRLFTGAAVLLIIGGATALGFGIWGNVPPPQPPASAATPSPASSSDLLQTEPSPVPSSPAATATPAAPPVTGPVLSRSTPTHIGIPAIEVDSALMELGLNEDGTPEVPPFDKDSPAGWYRGSPTPGELGPSIILGHVDTFKAGPVVFYRLGDMRPGDEVPITREDNTVAVFEVDRVVSFPKDDFPDLEVYGNTDRAELRLITCGGDYDQSAHRYVDDIVVFAHLVSSRPA